MQKVSEEMVTLSIMVGNRENMNLVFSGYLLRPCAKQ